MRFYRTSRPYHLPEIKYSFSTLRPAAVPAGLEPLGGRIEFSVDPSTVAPNTILRYFLGEDGVGANPFAWGTVPLTEANSTYSVGGNGWADLNGGLDLRFDSGSATITNVLISVVKTNALGQRTKYQDNAVMTANLKLSTFYQQLTIEGTPRAWYAIEYTDAAAGTNWLPLLTLGLPYSPYSFIDYASSNRTARSYRATGIPPE